MFSYVSTNKASLCHVSVSAVKGRLTPYLPQIQAPSPELGNAARPLHLLPSGKPMVFVGFVWAPRAIFRRPNLAYFLGVVRTKISTTRMSGQRVIIGNGQSSF